jgi:GGDEF domain-containing protein
MFNESVTTETAHDDPRKLSALIARASTLAQEHGVKSVLAGLICETGDLVFPEYIQFLQSALRVEDGIYRMTQERAVIYLADVDPTQAQSVLDRMAGDFHERFPALRRPQFQLRLFEVGPESEEIRMKDVLTQIFAARTLH